MLTEASAVYEEFICDHPATIAPTNVDSTSGNLGRRLCARYAARWLARAENENVYIQCITYSNTVVCVSDVLTIRIPSDLRKSMGFYDINWSDYLREAVRRKLVELRREKAFRRMDELRAKARGEDMAEEVLKWRKRH